MSVLILVIFTRQASTIILSNDVDISASNFNGFHDCVSEEANCKVVGAPRLFRPGAVGFDIDQLGQLKITIETEGRIPAPQWVALNVVQYPSLRPAPGPHGPLQLVLDHPSGPANTFELKNLTGYEDLKAYLERDHGDLIFTVAANFSNSPQLTPNSDLATITLSGFGQWVEVELLGDVEEPLGTIVEVVPPRSIDLALALVRMAVQSGARPVDIGVDGTNRPVGYTHTLGLPSQARLQGATLRLLLVPNNSFFTTDYILLDEGVRRVAAGEEGAPVVALSHVPVSPVSGPGGVGSPYVGTIDFKDVPLSLTLPPSGMPFPETPDSRRNLLGQLRDGRLNVIVTDDTTVIGSLLTVFLRDP